MKTIFKFSIAILIALSACHREKNDFLGPAYISVPDGFNVTAFSGTPSPVDFMSSIVKFNSTFTHSVSWTLTIKGQKSGAFRQIKGISKGFTNVRWNGSHDGIAFFRKGEQATATLSFYGTTYTSAITIDITDVPDFTLCGQFPQNGDFEDTSKIHFPNWARFNVAEQGVDSMAIDYNGNVVPAIQGKKYYYIKGLGTQAVFVDGIQYVGPMMPALPATPDNVWVNMFIYGTGNANTAVDIEYQEADADGTNFGYTGTDDDAFVAHITVDHVGWKLFSFKYSSLVPSANANFGGSGNKIHEPSTLMSFDLVLLKKSDPNSPVEVYFDYPIITVGGPFKPCK
jgi:hypothetical protein